MEEWSQGQSSTLAVLATGLGKTVIFSEIIRRIQPARTLVLTHRDTLTYQARDTIERFTGLKSDIEMAGLKADAGLFASSPVVISTIQTQNAGRNGVKRMSRFNPSEFGLVVTDEAHHYVAPSFKKVLDYYRQNPHLKILGVTATPDRADEEALGQVFTSVAFEYEIIDGIHDGWLVPIEQLMIPVRSLDYSHIKTTAGDLNLGELSRVMEEEENIQGMIQPTLEACSGLALHTLDQVPVSDWGKLIEAQGTARRTLVFCTSVKQAQRFAEVMNRVREGMAVAIWDKVPKDQRRVIFDDFRMGLRQVLVNVGICTEGFDCPEVEVVVMARATKSRSLYCQIIGRGTRPLGGIVDGIDSPVARREAIAISAKPGLLVCDFVGNSGEHKLMTSADILGGKVSDKAIELAKSMAAKSSAPVCMSAMTDIAEEILRQRIEEQLRRDAAQRTALVARSRFTSVKVSPFDMLGITPVKMRGWDMGKRISDKQAAVLRKQGINPDELNYTEAKQLLVAIFKRMNDQKATLKQANVLTKFGYDNAADLPYKEASSLIEKLRQNNWQRPTIKMELPEGL